MPAFKTPTFQERAALAAQAKQAALEKLRARPPIDEAVVAERRAAAEAKEAAKIAASAEKKAARERAAAEKAAAKLAEQQAREEAEALAKQVYTPSVPTAAEMKAARDARYAARKARVGRG